MSTRACSTKVGPAFSLVLLCPLSQQKLPAAQRVARAMTAAKSAAVLGPQELPELPLIDCASSSQAASPAVKRIHSDADVVSWQQSTAHQTIVLFLARLCESAVGESTRVCAENNEQMTKRLILNPIDAVLVLLDELQEWTKEIEPLKSPQRFGNLAFRIWGQRIEQRSTALHQRILPAQLHPFIPELETYLLGAFGSWIRLDYGSGHELSFLAWLCFLARLDFFPSDDDSSVATDRRLALEVFPKYLQVAWSLQDRYGLEPAGSHGVWGLDDFQFIPYAIGAAQLRNQTSYLPSAVTSTSHKPETRLPPEDLLRFIPTPTAIPASRTSTSHSIPPFANLYTTSIARIHSLKRGPFNEHSPILYDVATTVPSWVKVHSGMMKMWQAECLGKRPVVQHFPFGGVGFLWEGEMRNMPDDETALERPPQSSRAMPITSAPWKNTASSLRAKGAPWKHDGPVMAPTAAPWTRSSPSNLPDMASTGSAAAASSPFGIIPKPSIPPRSRRD